MLKILFISSADRWGGNEKWASMAMASLRVRHQVHFGYKSESLRPLFGDMDKEHKLSLIGRWHLPSFLELYRLIRDEKIDITVATKKQEWFLAGLACLLLGRKNVIRLGIVRRPSVPLWHRWIYGALNQGILTNSFRIRETLGEYDFIDPEKVAVIYNGLKPPIVTGQVERQPGTFRICSVGFLNGRKGHLELLQAVALLPEPLRKRVCVDIVGAGKHLEKLRNFVAAKGLEHQVLLHGFRTDAAEWIAAADLFVLLTTNEGISNAVLEAMSLGIPVLTTPAGGHSEFIVPGKNAYQIPTRQPSLVAKLLQSIMEDGDRTAIGQRGRETVERVFSMERMSYELDHFFAKVAGRMIPRDASSEPLPKASLSPVHKTEEEAVQTLS